MRLEVPSSAPYWLTILQAAETVYLLEPYHPNLNKRLVKASKLYLLDTGLGDLSTAHRSKDG